MKPTKPKNELTVFFTALVMIGVTFAGGIAYLRGQNFNKDALTADIANAVNPSVATTTSVTSTDTAAVVATSSTTSTNTAIIKEASTTPAKTVTPSPAQTPKPSPAPTSVPVPTQHPTPAPASTISATTTKNLPYTINTFSKHQGWEGWWGDFSVATDSLSVGADAGGTSGGALLGGTDAWGDYKFDATVDLIKGETFSLMAWYVDSNNYVQCLFDGEAPGVMHIEFQQYINGNEYTVAEGDDNNFYQESASNIDASILVQGNEGSCSFDSHLVSTIGSGNSINPPYHGGIGISTWDPATGNSQIIVKQISVTPLQ